MPLDKKIKDTIVISFIFNLIIILWFIFYIIIIILPTFSEIEVKKDKLSEVLSIKENTLKKWISFIDFRKLSLKDNAVDKQLLGKIDKEFYEINFINIDITKINPSLSTNK
jgi:uncharacterized membrane protein SpoIIM required for sporulation